MQEINGATYCFDTDGAMLTGWQIIDNDRYCFGADGAALTGQQELDGAVYCFDTDGAMLTGWQIIDSNKYYFDADGVMLTGQQEIEGVLYCFDNTGVERIALVKPPVDCVVALGEDAIVTFEAVGNGLTYEWWAKDVQDEIYYKSQTKFTNTYKTKANEERNGREIYCIITDRYGNVLETKPVVIKGE